MQISKGKMYLAVCICRCALEGIAYCTVHSSSRCRQDIWTCICVGPEWSL